MSAKQKAEEFAKQWRITGYQRCGYSLRELPLWVIDDIQKRIAQGYEAGYKQGHIKAVNEIIEKLDKRFALKAGVGGQLMLTQADYMNGSEVLIAVYDEVYSLISGKEAHEKEEG